jgi:hypothetical protein
MKPIHSKLTNSSMHVSISVGNVLSKIFVSKRYQVKSMKQLKEYKYGITANAIIILFALLVVE